MRKRESNSWNLYNYTIVRIGSNIRTLKNLTGRERKRSSDLQKFWNPPDLGIFKRFQRGGERERKRNRGKREVGVEKEKMDL